MCWKRPADDLLCGENLTFWTCANKIFIFSLQSGSYHKTYVFLLPFLWAAEQETVQQKGFSRLGYGVPVCKTPERRYSGVLPMQEALLEAGGQFVTPWSWSRTLPANSDAELELSFETSQELSSLVVAANALQEVV